MAATSATPVRAARPLLERRSAAAAAGAALVASVLCFASIGVNARGALAAAVVGVLSVLAAADLERRIIPNVIVVPATVCVLAARIAIQPDRATEWVVAGLVAGLFFLVVAAAYPAGLGMGDVKLAAFLGAALGTAVVSAVLIGLIGAALVGLGLVVVRGTDARKTALPLGLFLALAAVSVLVAGG
jgi:leader peptidase (prepilin peptidase)/N-methyltransferase